MKRKSIGRIIALLICMPVYFLVSALSIASSLCVYNDDFNLRKQVISMSTDKTMLVLVLTGTAFLFLAHAVLLIRSGNSAELSLADSRGITFLSKGTRGTARWMGKKEAEKVFTVGKIENTKETVFGQFDSRGRETVSYKDLNKGNRHFVVLGNSGAGKSFTFVRTELIQSVIRGDSFVTTDASGELYITMADFCRKHGYKVKVLNLHYPKNSMGWNCTEEIIDKETERMDGTRLSNFASVFMNNTRNGSESSFWFDGAINLFKAVLGVIAYRRETEIIQGIKKLVSSCFADEHEREAALKRCHLYIDENNYPSIREIKEEVFKCLQSAGYHHRDIAMSIQKIENASRPFTMSEVLKVLLKDVPDIGQWQKSFLDIPYGHPASIAFSIFNNPYVKDEVKASTQNGLCSRLNVFSDTSLRIALSTHDIVLEDFNRERTACFVIFNNKVNTMQPIMSLFFDFLFNDCASAYDREQARARTENRENSRLAISVVMDEFYSIGYIDNFVNFITNSRKSRINISIILQYSRQLYELYGDNDGTGIMSNCEVAILLNCNDRETAEYFSSFMTGMGTVMAVSQQSNRSLLGRMRKTGQENISEQSRSLMTLDEFRTMDPDYCLVIRRGNYPLKLRTFPYTEHPCYKRRELTESNPFEINSLKDEIDLSFMNLTVADAIQGRKGTSDVSVNTNKEQKKDRKTIDEIYNDRSVRPSRKNSKDVRSRLY